MNWATRANDEAKCDATRELPESRQLPESPEQSLAPCSELRRLIDRALISNERTAQQNEEMTDRTEKLFDEFSRGTLAAIHQWIVDARDRSQYDRQTTKKVLEIWRDHQEQLNGTIREQAARIRDLEQQLDAIFSSDPAN